MTSVNHKSRGFTFVEVLVALVIIAIGVAGLVGLQRMFIQSSERASTRAAAMEVARERLESLRFEDYETLAAGSETVTKAERSFSSSWTITGQYRVGGAWVTASSPSAPSPLPAQPEAKAVVVSVDWVERGGESESLELESWFTEIQARDGGLAVTQPGARGLPQVSYQAGAAPDVIAVRLTDNDAATEYQVKETTKPTPEVTKRDGRLRVRFDTVTYDQATQTQRIEDFVTVECQCTMGINTSTIGRTPARLTLQDGRLDLDPESSKPTTKVIGYPTGTSAPNESNYDYLAPANLDLCVICCRDHHDNSEMVAAGNVYRNEGETATRTASGNHAHFYRDNTGSLRAVTENNRNYEESCRMRRVDGYYVVYPDWKIEALSVMSADYLVNSATAANYTDYVRDVVYAEVMGSSAPAQPSGRDVDLIPGSYQMISRGVFIDDMSASHRQAVQTAIQNGEEDWLSKVPFYEVNLTLLSNWSSNAPSVATVTNEAIETVINPELNYYGTYSRGRVDTESDGTATIRSRAYSGNAAVLGGNITHPQEGLNTATSTLNASVDASGLVVLKYFRVTGAINCTFLKVTGNTTQEQTCGKSQLNRLALSVSSFSPINCYIDTSVTESPFYTCQQVPQGSSFSISFSYDGTANISPSSVSISDIQEDVNASDVIVNIE